jgi:hypothetical protein
MIRVHPPEHDLKAPRHHKRPQSADFSRKPLPHRHLRICHFASSPFKISAPVIDYIPSRRIITQAGVGTNKSTITGTRIPGQSLKLELPPTLLDGSATCVVI